jgi:hypothetical protein
VRGWLKNYFRIKDTHHQSSNIFKYKTSILKDFLDTIKQRFYAIDVKKSQSIMKEGKTCKVSLDIYNEIKIIT